jgi:hypothetical protein
MVRFLMCTVYTPRSSMSRGNGSASVRIYSVMIRCEYPLTIRIVRPHSFEHIDLHNYFCKIGKRDYVSSERSPSARGNGHLMSCGHSTPRTAGHQERAKINAQREAADSRNAVLGFEFCPRCPAVCPTTAFLEIRSTREIKTYQVDPDRPTYVSYYLARLNGYRQCGGSGVSPWVVTPTHSAVLQHRENPVCGTKRSRTGCVVAEAIAASKSAAEDRAERRARTVAAARLALDRAVRCPAACGPTTVGGDVAPTVRRAMVTRALTQARVPRFIAYYTAH